MKVWSDIFGSEDDFVFTGRGDDTLSSFYGNDFLFAGAGDDRIMVGDRYGSVFVSGGRGDDSITIAGTDGNYEIEQQGKLTIITTNEGMTLVLKGIEHIDWIF